MWTYYFEKIFLINLASRVDRLMRSCDELRKYDIQFELVRATPHVNGAKGLYLTMIDLFKKCLLEKLKRVLVFEDDVRFVANPNVYMPLCIEQLPDNWLQFYLGANLSKPHLVKRYSENLLETKRAVALHAVAYTAEVMEMIVSLPMQVPLDIQICNFIHPGGRIYHSHPLIASQYAGRSDIEMRNVDYYPFIEHRYHCVLENLKLR